LISGWRHRHVVPFGQDRLPDGVGLTHPHGILHPAHQPLTLAARLDVLEVGPDPRTLADRVAGEAHPVEGLLARVGGRDLGALPAATGQHEERGEGGASGQRSDGAGKRRVSVHGTTSLLV
jgi:hypothetical protein